MNNYVLRENKSSKNIHSKNFLRNAKQEFPCQSLESFSGEYDSMENKILDFQFRPVCAKQTYPNYSVGSDQDDGAEIQYDRWSTKERCNCEECEKMSTSSECVCCHEIQAVKAYHLKFTARLSLEYSCSRTFCCGI